jgi:hypothetical protein
MPIPDKFHAALSQEFTAFYNESELPESWDEWLEAELEREAAAGATRMRYWVAGADLPELAAFLRSESQNRQGDLVREIEGWTNSFWRYKDEKWNALQRILNALAEQLEAGEKRVQ